MKLDQIFNTRKSVRSFDSRPVNEKDILGIPNKIKVSALLAVGYPKDAPEIKRKRKPTEKIAFSETWGQPFLIDDRQLKAKFRV